MKKTFYLIAIGLLTAISATAQPINLTNTSTSVSHQWNPTNWPDNFQSYQFSQSKLANVSPPVFLDSTSAFANGGNGFTLYPDSFSQTSTNISYTWNAPPGMMFVVKAPPPALGPLILQFAASFNNDTSFMIFGSSGNVSFNVAYGTAPTNYTGGIFQYNPLNGGGQSEGLDLELEATIPTDGGSFAFTSVTVTYQIFISPASTWYVFNYSPWEPYAIYLSGGNSGDPTDPGPLLTLQPYSAAPPSPPALGIASYSNQPAVFFPTATGTNFVLQMTTNLASGNWVTVTNGVPFSCVVITNPSVNAFFRLH